ncbi:hypothetical protein [Anabaenopsis sp. FSS-46]|uniref:WD40 domain-containing protein n=1 Tax=Anabaenopsis sp. FSS-46 TaxID=2971766 RepID=UPI0032AF49C4
MNEPQPGKFDVVLGGTGNAPENALVLGGIQGAQQRYKNPDPKVRINAISQALNYGEDGVKLVLQALTTDESTDVKDAAYNLLSSRDNKSIQVIDALKAYELSPSRQRYKNPDPKVRINAISQALNYGDDGINLVLQALTTDESDDVKYVAYNLLRSKDNKSIQVIDALQAYELFLWREIATLTRHSDGVRSVAFSPDGKTLASGSWSVFVDSEKTIRLWDVATQEEIATLRRHSGSGVSSVAFSPDGRTLASAGAYGDNTIKLWNIATRREIATIRGHSDTVRSVAFSPDGKTLASGSGDKTIKLWDVATQKEITTLTGHSHLVHSVAFSPDGKTLASASFQTVKLWDVATRQEIATLRGHSSSVWSVAFSPDGKTLASGSRDKTIKLWDVATGKEIVTLTGHSDGVMSVAFSPDGKTLASGSRDKTIKLWQRRY